MATVIQTRAAFDAALAQDKKVILMLMGDGPGMDAIAVNADAAILFPQIQLAIWVVNVSIFAPEELAKYKPGDPEFVACSLSLPQPTPPRLVCAYVSRQFAIAPFFMKAIDAAQQRTQPPVVFK